MDVSYIETAQTSNFIKLEDKSFVHQFIDAKGKIWERNNFKETFEETICGQTNDSYKLNLAKIESQQTEEYFSVGSETVSKEFIDVERKIFDQEVVIKCEPIEDVEIDDENRTVISEADLSEEDSKTVLHELIDGKNWYDGSISEDFVNVEKIKEGGFAIQKETSEVNCSQLVLKKREPNFSCRNYKCSHCDYQTPRQSHLKSHVDGIHLGLKNHKCGQCDYQATQKINLMKHIENVHLRIKNFKCNQCDYQAYQKFCLIKHIESVHNVIRKHACNYCDYRGRRKQHLVHHIKTVHLGIKKHKCNRCDYQTTLQNTLKIHMNTVHLGIKDHKCSECDYETGRKDHLKDHINSIHLRIKTSNAISVIIKHL
ncbi:hypothetical protein HHI36_021686 [Cryptolaemus montrouzieri]|uniref:C2H2-type domain-containing protein n=1 Tax=Cryptolaemus montrouzieri TaxID=559131 RepID=A0ABD2MY97_9CUCU